MRQRDGIAVLLATCGGVGRLPVAPGTWGSIVGLGLGVLSARCLGAGVAIPMLLIGFVVCAAICTRAERALGLHDPPAVNLDEVWGMAAVIMVWPHLAGRLAPLSLAFLFFRLFDMVKPPPLQRLAKLPRGWGIMADDAGATAYTLLALWAIRSTRGFV